MTEQTRMMIRTAANCDATITDAERGAIDALLEGGAEPKPERVIPVAEVARIFGKTRQTIDLWTRQGYLRKVTVGKNSRASGVLASSVEALLKGGAA